MNSVKKANQSYYSRNKDRLIQMSLNYYYENKDIILSQSKIKAKTYYCKIKYTPKYFRKLLLASVRLKIKLKITCFFKTNISSMARFSPRCCLFCFFKSC